MSVGKNYLNRSVFHHPPEHFFNHKVVCYMYICAFSEVKKAHPTVVKEIVAKVRDHIGPVASFKDVLIVSRLPKTRSGKIARNTIAAIAAGQPYKVCM